MQPARYEDPIRYIFNDLTITIREVRTGAIARFFYWLFKPRRVEAIIEYLEGSPRPSLATVNGQTKQDIIGYFGPGTVVGQTNYMGEIQTITIRLPGRTYDIQALDEFARRY